MAREPQSAELHGHCYTVTTLGTSRGVELVRRLGKVIGPAIGTVLDGTDASVSLVGMFGAGGEDVVALGQAVAKSGDGLFRSAVDALVAGATKTDTDFIISECAKTTRVQLECEGKLIHLPQIYEVHFQGELGKLGEWLLFALKVQLGLFSDGSESEAISQADPTDQP